MGKDQKKQDIVINVDPEMTVLTMGLLIDNLDPFVDYLKEHDNRAEQLFTDDMLEIMHGVIGEVFDSCTEQTDVRERIETMAEVYKMTGGMKFPTEES
jgi:hypothetical protein